MKHGMSNYTIIVDPLSTGQEYPAAFREAGRLPVAVLSGAEPPPAYTASWHPGDFEHVHYFTGDVQALAEELRQYEPEYLIPGAESGVELCDQLIEFLVPGTGNVSELASARRDKWEMAQALAAAGVPRLRQFRTADPADAEKWLKENDLLGRRLVIKPPKSAAGDEVYVVFEDGDWRERFDRVLGRTNKMGLTNDAVLIQEYAEGTEYLVDTYSVDGKHALVDVCRYTKVGRGDKIGIYRRIDFLAEDDPEVQALWPYTEQVLDAVGIRIGCGHVEVMMTPDGPRLIEVAARPAGGGHQMVSELATGDNHIKRTVAHRVRGEVRDGFDLVQHLRGIFVIAPREGYFRNREVFDGIDALKSFQWMKILYDEDAVVPETVDLFTCLAWVILIHSDPATLDADYHRVLEMEAGIVIETR
ncbi:ATP-grasp domain-containing protein [Kribbella steppae]|uniref:ATP-grasp domain-containing protein n=1 Tax=Kribbella steppae TaxID=2512223 RepID=A0A4R2H9Z9_9ACTN|nr:ATP-grasp domain-containing protein [Kribbella steppae]TCO23502.1 ATP-grasp domain-containing protein [Kribbella steppae]